MAVNLKKLVDNATFAALAGSVLASAVAICGAYYSSQSAISVQRLQYRQQLITSLNTGSGKVVAEGGLLISYVNARKPLDLIKQELRILVAQQLEESESLRTSLNLTGDDLQYYQDALTEFEHKTLAVRGTIDMPEWAVSFGHLLDVQRVLNKRLQRSS